MQVPLQCSATVNHARHRQRYACACLCNAFGWSRPVCARMGRRADLGGSRAGHAGRAGTLNAHATADDSQIGTGVGSPHPKRLPSSTALVPWFPCLPGSPASLPPRPLFPGIRGGGLVWSRVACATRHTPTGHWVSRTPSRHKHISFVSPRPRGFWAAKAKG